MGSSASRRSKTSGLKSATSSPKDDVDATSTSAQQQKQKLKVDSSFTSIQVQQSPLSDAEVKQRLNKFIETIRAKREWECKHLPTIAEAKKPFLIVVRQTLQKVAKEKADVNKIQNPVKSSTDFLDLDLTEQEEYLKAANHQEKECLDMIKNHVKKFEKEFNDANADMNRLLGLYVEQEQILDELFSRNSASDLEKNLRVEVESLLDRKVRIAVTKLKWTNSRLLLQYACNQLTVAVDRWRVLPQVPPTDAEAKLELATWTKENLKAASQNISGAKQYLNNIKFPYCKTEEMDALDQACGNIYFDMQFPARYSRALQCYSFAHTRCAALLQWCENVINDIIVKDLTKAQADLARKQAELKKERLRLMREMLGGKDGSEDVLEQFDEDMLEPDLMADRVDRETQALLAPAVSGDASVSTLLPLNELAPPPSEEELFGNIEQLRKQHEREVVQIEKAQKTNKARMEQGLQEKLKQRMKRRQTLESIEVSQLGEGSKDSTEGESIGRIMEAIEEKGTEQEEVCWMEKQLENLGRE